MKEQEEGGIIEDGRVEGGRKSDEDIEEGKQEKQDNGRKEGKINVKNNRQRQWTDDNEQE